MIDSRGGVRLASLYEQSLVSRSVSPSPRNQFILRAPEVAAGSFVHDSPYTVTGSGFGTKATAAPSKYDDFQSVTLGSEIVTSTAPGLAWTNNGGASQSINPVASNALLRSGTPFTRNMRSRWLPSGGSDPSACSVVLSATWTVVHLDAWIYHDLSGKSGGSSPNTNAKHVRLHCAPGAGDPNLGFTDEGSSTFGLAGDGRANYFTPTTGQAQFTGWTTASSLYDQWYHVRWLIDVGSGNAVEDGRARIYYNNNLRMTTDVASLMRSGFTSWHQFYIGNYVRGGDWSGTQSAYWESVYVDSSWARVEIGDNATYASCTHTEIQVPTSWSSNSITFTAKRGSFPVGSDVHLFVTDSNNVTQNVGSVQVAA